MTAAQTIIIVTPQKVNHPYLFRGASLRDTGLVYRCDECRLHEVVALAAPGEVLAEVIRRKRIRVGSKALLRERYTCVAWATKGMISSPSAEITTTEDRTMHSRMYALKRRETLALLLVIIVSLYI